MNVYIDRIRIGFLMATHLARFALNMNVYISKHENLFEKIFIFILYYVV